jgi:hypothetical protein
MVCLTVITLLDGRGSSKPEAPNLEAKKTNLWAAPGFVDTEIGVTLEPEDDHGTEKDLQPRVQA